MPAFPTRCERDETMAQSRTDDPATAVCYLWSSASSPSSASPHHSAAVELNGAMMVTNVAAEHAVLV